MPAGACPYVRGRTCKQNKTKQFQTACQKHQPHRPFLRSHVPVRACPYPFLLHGALPHVQCYLPSEQFVRHPFHLFPKCFPSYVYCWGPEYVPFQGLILIGQVVPKLWPFIYQTNDRTRCYDVTILYFYCFLHVRARTHGHALVGIN